MNCSPVTLVYELCRIYPEVRISMEQVKRLAYAVG